MAPKMWSKMVAFTAQKMGYVGPRLREALFSFYHMNVCVCECVRACVRFVACVRASIPIESLWGALRKALLREGMHQFIPGLTSETP